MLANERRMQILEELHEKKSVVVQELSQRFHVSEETIRRDLDKFQQEGVAIKGYGGATLNDDNKVELPFHIRKKKNIAEKQKIGLLAAALIPDGTSIMLDASSTSVYIARALKKKSNLTVITNSLEILMDLADADTITVIGTGGTLHGDKLAFYGPSAIGFLRNCHTEYACVSCKGIHMESKLTDFEEIQTEMESTMLAQASHKILAADTGKFGQTALLQIADFTDIHTILTDTDPGREWLTFFKKQGITCHYS